MSAGADPAGPFLVIAAFWDDNGDTDAVAHALRSELFPAPAGYPKGAVVAFRREIATGASFLRDLERFDLGECRPTKTATAA